MSDTTVPGGTMTGGTMTGGTMAGGTMAGGTMAGGTMTGGPMAGGTGNVVVGGAGPVTYQGPRADPYDLGHAEGGVAASTAPGRGTGGPAPKRIIVGYGFWIFILSDIIMFSAFFATYAVLRDATAGGPTGTQIFDLPNTAIETACLLLSSFTCGMASLAADARNRGAFYLMMALTGALGAVFLGLELHEFIGLVADGAGPGRSAFLSSFFTLVGCHGLHVFCGLLWLLTMMAQVFTKGFRADIMRRILCFALFWHALDIIWVALFTVVYLMGVAA